MKNYFLFLIAGSLLFLFPNDGLGQNVENPWSIHFGLSYRDFEGVPNNEFLSRGLEPVLSFGVGRYLNPSFNADLRSGFDFINITDHTKLSKLTDLDLSILYKFNNGYLLKEDFPFSPYLHVGIGASYTEINREYWNTHIPWGAGIRLFPESRVSVDFRGSMKRSISDFEDYFALDAGMIVNLGKGKLRDSDGDGVPDREDECPKEAGPVSGCPDVDGDGIADRLDNCPEEAGIARLQGCPEPIVDQDGDGINDEEDACPTLAGVAQFNGCPDTDADGVADAEDKCPRVAGVPELDGCPDSDGDGVTDEEDECPNEAGMVGLQGCPDTDGDLIPDKDDKCPEEAGTKELNGCPEIDEETQETLDFAAQNVAFQTGRSNLTFNSFKILDDIVEILNKYPSYKLKATGYTDSVGSAEKNQQLSEARAKSCIDYLSGEGIDADRLSSSGLGEENPIADNKTAAGRAQNRRVEFELYLPE